MRTSILVWLLLALTLPALAAPFEVYLNNKPFPGAVSGPAGDLMLEAGPYFKITGGQFRFDGGTGQASLDGESIPVTVVDGRAFVRAREMVKRVGGRYNVNQALGTVDIYAFDPVEAARKAMTRILSMKSIDNDLDFRVMASVTRGIMTRSGFDLDFPVELLLATSEEIVAAGGGRDLGTLTRWTYRPGGTGIANAKVLVLKGRSPLMTMDGLACGWGSLYAARLGLNKQEDLTLGLGLWAGYHVLEQLGAPVRAESWGVKQKPAERAEFRKFLEIDQQGGPKAVLNALQQIAPKT